MLESVQRLSPDTAGASALGAAEAGPDRSLVRRGMGKGMRMTWAGGMPPAERSLAPQSPATMDTAVAPRSREGEGVVERVLALTG